MPMTKKKFPILVVDDEPVSRNILEKFLHKAGYQVVAAENGLEALQVLKDNFIPIVITDWMMPEMDGLELCKAIRKTNFPGYIFSILITSRDSKEDIVAGLESGADEYLTKPFNNAELRARLYTAERILKLEKSLKKANEEIRQLSITDPLTNCFNRGYLNQRLPHEISRSRRYSRPLSIIMCDIDHFKKINDAYGHQVGDEILKKLVESIKSEIRVGVDWIARYGGEEFIIVVPETNLEGAEVLAERLRQTVSKEIVKAEKKNLSITASFGVTCFDCSKHSDKTYSETMIKEADSSLYQAKNEGRNRVKVFK